MCCRSQNNGNVLGWIYCLNCLLKGKTSHFRCVVFCPLQCGSVHGHPLAAVRVRVKCAQNAEKGSKNAPECVFEGLQQRGRTCACNGRCAFLPLGAAAVRREVSAVRTVFSRGWQRDREGQG